MVFFRLLINVLIVLQTTDFWPKFLLITDFSPDWSLLTTD